MTFIPNNPNPFFLSNDTKYKELIKAQEEYITLLGDEINSMCGIASVHGWESKNSQAGAELREKIEKIKAELQ